MQKKPLIAVSICAVVLLVLASLTNVVGYQTVQSSNQKIISTEINEKDLLFQTIVDMANNKEIQRVILGSELTSKKFFDSGLRFSTFYHPVVTKRFLTFAYQMGLILSKTISKSKIHSMLERYRMDKEIQSKLSSVIEKTAITERELTQLMNYKCDCGNDNLTQWKFPIFCTYLALIFLVVGFFYATFDLFFIMYWLTLFLGVYLNCWWAKFVWQPPWWPDIN